MSNFESPVRSVSKVSDINNSLNIPASPFLQQLGYGTGVQVYRLNRSAQTGNIHSPWALKYITKKKCQQADCPEIDDRLNREANILRRLDHPYIVGFRAFSNLPDGRKVLAMEDCEISLGDIIERRQEDTRDPFAAFHILKMISDMACALSYLHDEMFLLHGDVKSHNILVKGDFAACKLCDFGVSIPLDENGVLKPNHYYHGTELWAAPETITETVVTSKADMFALGLTVWEMLSLQPPHVSIECVEEEILDIAEKNNDSSDYFNDSLDSRLGTRPDLPDLDFSDDYNPVLEVFHILTEQDAKNRPSASLLVKIMNKYNL